MNHGNSRGNPSARQGARRHAEAGHFGGLKLKNNSILVTCWSGAHARVAPKCLLDGTENVVRPERLV
jgi:hypothetical protein